MRLCFESPYLCLHAAACPAATCDYSPVVFARGLEWRALVKGITHPLGPVLRQTTQQARLVKRLCKFFCPDQVPLPF